MLLDRKLYGFFFKHVTSAQNTYEIFMNKTYESVVSAQTEGPSICQPRKMEGKGYHF